MASDDDLHHFEDDTGEATAVINIDDVKAAAAKIRKDRRMLIRMDGTSVGQVVSLGDKVCTLGRLSSSDVWLNDDGISRRHARVYFAEGVHVVEDNDSANGTYVQGQKINGRRTLRDGDVVQFGPTVIFRYSVTDSDEEQMLRQLYEAAVRDPLTNVFNREHFEERMKVEVSYAKRHKTDVALVMFDVDHFKNVNDTYGHQAGDAVLIKIAELASAGLRTEDVVARYGGEEFAVILRGIDLEGAVRVGERLRVRVAAKPIEGSGHQVAVTVSCGCAVLTECPEQSVTALVAIADRRLYAAKRGGRNQVVSID